MIAFYGVSPSNGLTSDKELTSCWGSIILVGKEEKGVDVGIVCVS